MAEQSLTCAGCGQPVLPNWNNCPGCGQPLQGVGASPSAPASSAPIQAGDGSVVNARIDHGTHQAGGSQPMISVGAESVVEATIDASTEIHVQGQYVQNQNVYNVSSVSPDLVAQLEGQGEHVRQLGQAVQKLLEQHQIQHRELRAGDSLSIRNDNERQLVKQLVARYRALPEGDRKEVPALLHAIGKLEVVSADFDAAIQDFQAVAQLEQENRAKAEAHYHAYLACLEKRDWKAAIQELVKAIKLDAKRFAPFPVGKYQPVRILGAGGFGVAFLCKHKHMDAQVVVKTLTLEDLGRDADKVFSEAQVLRQLDHPAVIRISDCGYADAANKSRPFLVMDYFAPGKTLEQYVKDHGPLEVEELLEVARQVAEGLHSAHGKGILHRDVKPANLLVRQEAQGWKAKVIDFGLALRQKVAQKSLNASTANRGKTLIGGSIAGTQDYAAPEQMGKREEAVGTYSDVYGWAKTCCHALFETTQPTLRHWQSVPGPLADLLGRCLEVDPKKRPQRFADILAGLKALRDTPAKQGLGRRPTTKRARRLVEDPERTLESRERTAKRKRPSSPILEQWVWGLIGGCVGLGVLAILCVLLMPPGLKEKPTVSSPYEEKILGEWELIGGKRIGTVTFSKGGLIIFTWSWASDKSSFEDNGSYRFVDERVIEIKESGNSPSTLTLAIDFPSDNEIFLVPKGGYAFTGLEGKLRRKR